MVRMVSAQALNCRIQIEQQRALPVITDHALDPEERGIASTAGYRCDVVKAGGRVQNHMPGRQFHRMRAIRVLNNQFSSVVLVWVREKQRGGKIGTNAMTRSWNLADGIVDVGSERVPSLIAIEQGREDDGGQGGRDEQRVPAQGAEDQFPQFLRRGMSFGYLKIIFSPSRLMTCRHSAIHPLRRLQHFSRMRQ